MHVDCAPVLTRFLGILGSRSPVPRAEFIVRIGRERRVPLIDKRLVKDAAAAPLSAAHPSNESAQACLRRRGAQAGCATRCKPLWC
eukprot:scaffold229956_cov36-Tisochrysis_lutea.AAC.1